MVTMKLGLKNWTWDLFNKDALSQMLVNGHLNLDMSEYLHLYSSDDHYTLKRFWLPEIEEKLCEASNVKFSYFNRIVDS